MKICRRNHKPLIEILEARDLLAGSLSTTGPLSIVGTPSDDVILVEAMGSFTEEVKVTVNGSVTGTFRPSGPIAIKGLAGNDTIQVAPGVLLATQLDGGPGVDTIRGGGGDDWILTRDGAGDTIDGGLGTDRAATDSLDLVAGIEYLNPMPVAPDNQTQHVKVLVLNFEPEVPSEGDKKLWQVFGWNVSVHAQRAVITRTVADGLQEMSWLSGMLFGNGQEPSGCMGVAVQFAQVKAA